MGGATVLAAKQFALTADAFLAVELPLFALLHGISINLVDINALFVRLVYSLAASALQTAPAPLPILRPALLCLTRTTTSSGTDFIQPLGRITSALNLSSKLHF
jgi:hypothetical protein